MSLPAADADVAAVREFNRFYTGVLGLLREGLLDTPYSLTEARIIFELARQDEVEVAEVRRWLDLDPGYLSRILARFEADGLVRKSRSAGDARRQVIALTPAGRAASGRLDALSSDQIRGLLAPIPPGRRSRLTAAMAGIREVLGGAAGPGQADDLAAGVAGGAGLAHQPVRLEPGQDPAQVPGVEIQPAAHRRHLHLVLAGQFEDDPRLGHGVGGVQQPFP